MKKVIFYNSLDYLHKRATPIAALFAFIVSFLVYALTLESTVSLWDCGEFITAAYGLQIPHPPGSPLFIMLAHFATLFAPSSAWVPFCTNMLSALCSAGSVALLFLLIQAIATKIFLNIQPSIICLGALAAALSFAFTDSFWFSAVETEVYALSSFFTLCCLYIAWIASQSDCLCLRIRSILLLSFVLGISVTVHMLNLLVIPALVILLYPRGNHSLFNWLAKAIAFGVIALVVAMIVVVKYSIRAASFFERLLINEVGLPIHSGWIIFYSVILLFLFIVALFSHKHKWYKLYLLSFSLFFFLVGFSLYFTVIIRSAQNPLLNENAPYTIIKLQSYLEREQYTQAPLLRGPSFASPVVGFAEADVQYQLVNHRYDVVGKSVDALYNPQTLVWFPRMYSTDAMHFSAYKSWCNFVGQNIQLKETKKNIVVPTTLDNLRYFVNYQLNYMYLRYVLWNFAGRQNDIQGNGGILRGNWISGFDCLDSLRLGNQCALPSSFRNANTRTGYYGIPLLLILFGFFTLRKANAQTAGFIILWFVFTGVAVAIFLNMTPMQARERDYAFIGSYLALAVCMALGFIQLLHYISTLRYVRYVNYLLLVALPFLFLQQNYASHNRSQRVAARTAALHLLESCPKQSILFTVGDNDTFPLWYLQQVEGIRTDVSVVNTLLLFSPWYIQQLNRKGKEDEAIITKFHQTDFYYNQLKSLRFSKADSSILLIHAFDSLKIAKNMHIAAKNVIVNVCNPFNDSLHAVQWNIGDTKLQQNQLVILDVILHNSPQRPICFTAKSSVNALNIKELLQPVGLVYCFTNDTLGAQNFNTYVWQHRLLMHSYKKGTLDFFHQQNIYALGYRDKAANTAIYLLEQSKNEQAASLIRSMLYYTPEYPFPQCCNSKFIDILKQSGNPEEANLKFTEWKNRATAELKWLNELPQNLKALSAVEIDRRQLLLKKLDALTY